MPERAFPKLSQFRTPNELRARLVELGLSIPCDDAIQSAATGSPLAQPLDVGGFTVGNRWCIHPMEGWDGSTSGEPTARTLRRWKHFGESGAKLIWGGEAFAVQSDGRANPNQLGIVDDDVDRAEKGVRNLFQALLEAHGSAVGSTDDLLVGLQLTHSGRFCRPCDKRQLEPRIAYHHPILDPKFGISPNDSTVVITDDYLKRLIENYVKAAKLAQQVGFRFVDVKHCHGYLGHEFLGSHTRGGDFGGSFENRTRFLREIVQGIRAATSGLHIGVRISAFDMVPFRQGSTGEGEPEVPDEGYRWAFGHSPQGGAADVRDCDALLALVAGLGIEWVCLTGGSPYYNPHIQRPALFPPSDGYLPPEDPLVGVARQIRATAALKARHPNLVVVGSGYSYLQEWLPHVAQHVVRTGMADFVGVGRLILSYPEFPKDVLEGRPLQRNRLCRTFSDCTTGPRNGLVSGCYPLDPFYADHPHASQLRDVKARQVAPST
jgi:2,4-dienoyl-CoA reductase-like NADH-dependent reductase (Old Yellow Enzyme family)